MVAMIESEHKERGTQSNEYSSPDVNVLNKDCCGYAIEEYSLAIQEILI